MHKEDQIFAPIIFKDFFAQGQLVKPIDMNCVWADEEKKKTLNPDLQYFIGVSELLLAVLASIKSI